METVLHNILASAVEADASDVHIKENAPVAFRMGNAMTSCDFTPDRPLLEAFLKEVATPRQLESFEETGDLDLSHREDQVGRFRVNVHKQRGLLSINFRWVKNVVRTFEELGLPAVLGDICGAHRGIVILTGTTGSGKSTTLAAMLEYINRREHLHVITIEDPIEYEFMDDKCYFEQREVGLDTISFDSALKHALRQDPDIIMVGEMRDRTSFEAALQAADTGHLVLTTLHASNASQTINRILDFFTRDEQDSVREALAVNLKAVISQRLAPRAMGGGRVPVQEIMINNPMVSKLLHENRIETLPSAISAGRNEGMMTFNQCLLELVNNGVIAEEDAMEFSDNPEALKMNLQGIELSSDVGGLVR